MVHNGGMILSWEDWTYAVILKGLARNAEGLEEYRTVFEAWTDLEMRTGQDLGGKYMWRALNGSQRYED